MKNMSNCFDAEKPLPFAKSQKPAKELVADFYLCGDTEVGFIHFVILDILRAKAVNHGIQKRIDETNLYKPLFAAVNGENPLGVYCFRSICLNASSPSLGSL